MKSKHAAARRVARHRQLPKTPPAKRRPAESRRDRTAPVNVSVAGEEDPGAALDLV